MYVKYFAEIQLKSFFVKLYLVKLYFGVNIFYDELYMRSIAYAVN